jgi:hypothetical protein
MIEQPSPKLNVQPTPHGRGLPSHLKRDTFIYLERCVPDLRTLGIAADLPICLAAYCL